MLFYSINHLLFVVCGVRRCAEDHGVSERSESGRERGRDAVLPGLRSPDAGCVLASGGTSNHVQSSAVHGRQRTAGRRRRRAAH